MLGVAQFIVGGLLTSKLQPVASYGSQLLLLNVQQEEI